MKRKILFLCRSGSLDGCICSGSQCRWAGFKRSRYYWRQPSPSWKAPEVAVAEKSVAPVASNYAAPANVTEQSVAPASKVAASESGTPSVEKATEASMTEKEETPLPSNTGSTTFFNTGAHAPAGRSTDVAVQPKSFVDVVAITETLVLETTVP